MATHTIDPTNPQLARIDSLVNALAAEVGAIAELAAQVTDLRAVRAATGETERP